MLLFFAKSIQWKVADAKEDDQMIKINLQRFAEGDPDVNKPAEKSYSEQYVKDLRDECKEHRTARKAAEQAAEQWKSTAAKIIGAAEGKDITESDIAAYQADNTRKLAEAGAKANERLILAEIRSQQGINHKLAERLIDRTKLTISDDGKVQGLAEALDALAADIPEIKTTATGSGANPANASANLPKLDALKTSHADALKNGRTAEAIALKSQIFEIEKGG